MSNLKQKIARFNTLPYTRDEYKKRNWGHKLHSLCSYPSKLKPCIANILVNYFSKEGDVVLDPFSGSGTVVFEACNSGRIGIAVDLSPFAYRLSSAKTNVPSKKQMLQAIKQLDAYILANSKKIPIENIDKEIKSFYHIKTLKEIVCAKRFCLENPQKIETNVIHFLWSAIAHLLHGNRPYALSRRSHNIIPIPPKGDAIYKSLIVSLKSKIERIYEPLDEKYTIGKAFCASAFDLPVSDSSIDVIITSPPFLGTTDFLRHNRVRLWFAGWDISYQKTKKDDFLESKKTMDIYSELLTEFYRVLRPHSLLIFHLGVVKNVDMAKEISSLSKKAGFRTEDIIYEDVTRLESHGRTDRGSTHKHQFLFLSKH